jgi:hypothetical protein
MAHVSEVGSGIQALDEADLVALRAVVFVQPRGSESRREQNPGRELLGRSL